MIEQAIYFGLGCAVAGLLALLFLPVLWARALRLTRARLQRQIPVSMQEILADRDHLRAEFAVERRKLEQAMERVRSGKAQDMAALGRQAVETANLTETVAALHASASGQEVQFATLSRELEEARAEAGSLQVALHDAHEALARRSEAHEGLLRAHDALEESSEQRRLTVAALSTRALGLEMTIEDRQRAVAALERQVETLRQREGSEASPLEDEAAALPDDLPAAQARIRRLEADLQTRAREARERDKGMHLQRSLQAERARGESRAELEKVEAMQAEIAALRGALEAARHAPALEATDGDAQLRTSIHAIGLAVARMTAAADAGDEARPASARVDLGAGAPGLA